VKQRNKQKPEKPDLLTLEGARRMIRRDRAHYEDWYVAGLILCISQRSTFDDLLACLKRRETYFRAARVLHQRTGRPLADGKEITNFSDWSRYLKAKGKI